ncbi:MAG: acyl-CoA reductase [Bacteroidia bacterium]
MNLSERVDLLTAVGASISADLKNNRLDDLFFRVESENPWFVKRFVSQALNGVCENYLSKNKLSNWSSGIKEPSSIKTIGLVPAGNIPLVGLHDLLSVFISGHNCKIKPSSKDQLLLTYLLNTMYELEPALKSKMQLIDRLTGFDAVIATGSDNTNRYFEYYFGKYPSLLRKNRNSTAVIDENTSDADLRKLSDDIYTYFGLGCRSVSKVYIPNDFDLVRLIENISHFDWIGNLSKYHNNYMYQKSIYLVNKVSHFDTGFMLLRESAEISSAIGVLHYQKYVDKDDLSLKLADELDKTQVVVGGHGLPTPRVVSYGQAQNTGLLDYADGKNTLEFLASL